MDTKFLIEAALFSAGKPLATNELAEACGIGPRQVNQHLKTLVEMYEARDTSLEIAKVGRKWIMQIKREYLEYTGKLADTEIPLKLIRTAALIAYHQPLLQSQLVEMIGPKAYDHVRELLHLKLINSKAVGQTRSLTSSHRFSEYFGIDTTSRAKIKEWLAKQAGIAIEKTGGKIDDYE